MAKRKKIWIFVGAALFLLIVVLSIISSGRKNVVTVQTSAVKRKDVLVSKVTASGEIRAQEFVDLQSEIAGIITDLLVREGASVKSGDILLRIDPVQTEAERDSSNAQFESAQADVRAQEFLIMNAEANLQRDEASLHSARVELTQAENNYERMESSFRRRQSLYEDALISRDDYEIAQLDLKSAESRLEVSKAQLSQVEKQVVVSRNNILQNKASAEARLANAKAAMARLRQASNQLEKTTLFSPLDGVVTQLNVEKGERAQPGIMSNPQATLMTIANLGVIQAELRVDETDIVNLTLGDIAEVRIDALPNDVFEGEVTEIGNSPIQSSGVSQEARDFKVIVTLKNPSPKLRPGMSCTGDITTDTRENVLSIPIQALTVRDVTVEENGKYNPPTFEQARASLASSSASGSDDKDKKKELEGVFVIDKNNRAARFRDIKTGITGESEIEVLENLEVGEEIVTGSFQTLRTIRDGAAVKTDTTRQSNR
ncbi:MAG: efflux RND transporter periplasmic adaptor subunit [Acidobacteriota bacterium]|jgi:HlyD family secretion protein|nr:efflux RND transporter periplasmic adaptor subunit [Acidobacteriota bacterium]